MTVSKSQTSSVPEEVVISSELGESSSEVFNLQGPETLDAGDQTSPTYDEIFDPTAYGEMEDPVAANPDFPVCALCEAPITGRPVNLLGRYWHKEHSMCKECSRPIGVDNFAEIDGYLYCEDHYIEHRGSYVIRKSESDKRQPSKIASELELIRKHSNVRRVRNLLDFERSIRLNIITVDDPSSSSHGDIDPTANRPASHSRPKRFVTSTAHIPGHLTVPLPSPSSSPGSAVSVPPNLDSPALRRRLASDQGAASAPVQAPPPGSQPLGGLGRHASVVGARAAHDIV
ncbi:Transforming growth factor beta-1-induced transcript 1 protein [Cladochytrium tenue]|nr:Transforming growth factor beta-1-induced transcript 1 protein [Cladochytrium tenue]